MFEKVLALDCDGEGAVSETKQNSGVARRCGASSETCGQQAVLPDTPPERKSVGQPLRSQATLIINVAYANENTHARHQPCKLGGNVYAQLLACIHVAFGEQL